MTDYERIKELEGRFVHMRKRMVREGMVSVSISEWVWVQSPIIGAIFADLVS